MCLSEMCALNFLFNPGPHKERECLPLVVILRNRLKYALTYREVVPIVMQRLIQIDWKVRTDKCYPAGFMEEAKYKLCKVREANFGNKGVPYISTNDGRTIRYPDPLIKRNDTVKIDIETRKVVKFIKFDVGNLCMVTGGRNRGRIGTIQHREKHKGSFDIIHVVDSVGYQFATRMANVFTIGQGTKPWVTLLRGKGIKLSIVEEARNTARITFLALALFYRNYISLSINLALIGLVISGRQGEDHAQVGRLVCSSSALEPTEAGHLLHSPDENQKIIHSSEAIFIFRSD
ncbi:hypothetical protein R1sor_005647 [Riccia sorocarpa]|uniref:KOW domain-containing protein n=1 Tax=Riccia sorocarpa TaxID=122646 RepID=A0ABD3HM38_9MARC